MLALLHVRINDACSTTQHLCQEASLGQRGSPTSALCPVRLLQESYSLTFWTRFFLCSFLFLFLPDFTSPLGRFALITPFENLRPSQVLEAMKETLGENWLVDDQAKLCVSTIEVPASTSKRTLSEKSIFQTAHTHTHTHTL